MLWLEDPLVAEEDKCYWRLLVQGAVWWEAPRGWGTGGSLKVRGAGGSSRGRAGGPLRGQEAQEQVGQFERMQEVMLVSAAPSDHSEDME